jgi:tRNA (guanine10-N2)-methyltransferase
MLGDPPYGVRAGGRKSCARPGAMIRDRATHIPPTAPYGLTECLDDLLQLAAQLLVTGGRAWSAAHTLAAWSRRAPWPFVGASQPRTHQPRTSHPPRTRKPPRTTTPTGGRLVFWMPSAPDLYREDELPAHPMLSMVANSEQMVSARYSRRLITLV